VNRRTLVARCKSAHDLRFELAQALESLDDLGSATYPREGALSCGMRREID